MFNKYYQQQLANLRERAAKFAQAHPSIAPLLGKTSADPDVERLLEGTAYLCGLIHQRLDDDFPEIIHGLTDVVFPHLLRPIPSTSIVTFTPKESLLEHLPITTGTLLGSTPTEGTQCLFRTCMHVDMYPMSVKAVTRKRLSTSEEALTVSLQLHSVDLSSLAIENLRFYLGGSFAEATNLFMALQTNLRQIQISVPQKPDATFTLTPDSLSVPGFDLENSLFTTPGHSFRGYGILSEYFILPQKFLFLELSGLKRLQQIEECTAFDIEFILETTDKIPVTVQSEHFSLFTTPVINLFNYEAEPTTVDHHAEKLLIQPAGRQRTHFSIYTIDSVIGFGQGTVERRKYVPLNRFSYSEAGKTGVFQTHRSHSNVNNSQQVYLSLVYNEGETPRREILSIELTCTNSHLPELLRMGDICEATSQSPELVDFRNILAPTPQIDTLTGGNELWRFLSHVSLNFLPSADTDSLRELLRPYIFDYQRSDQYIAANIKRIDAITGFTSKPIDRLVRGALMRGVKLQLTAAGQHFASAGDLYVFASVLDRFMALYASMNTFTQFELCNTQSGEVVQWPPRLGEKQLI